MSFCTKHGDCQGSVTCKDCYIDELEAKIERLTKERDKIEVALKMRTTELKQYRQRVFNLLIELDKKAGETLSTIQAFPVDMNPLD